MTTTHSRLQALDVMRGIAVAAMILFNNAGHKYAPLCHAEWNGLTPTDLAYPFFMFIMGVAVCFSLRKYADGEKGKALVRIFRRTASIFVLGVILSNLSKVLGGTFTWENMRIMGVLQRLAVVYCFGALIYLYAPEKSHLPIAALLLIGYIVLLKCFNGYVHSEDNVLARFDCLIMGRSHLYTEKVDGVRIAFEPESILGSISGIAHVLIGSYVGRLIVGNIRNIDRVRKIALFGTGLLFLGFLLQYLDPINKKIWTSSFTLVTCGAASLLLAALIEIVEIRGKEKWAMPFKVFGTNAVLVYTLAGVLGSVFSTFGVKKWILDTFLVPALGVNFGNLVYAILLIVVIWQITLPLYWKKIYVRL